MTEESVIEILENLKGVAAYYIDKPEEQALTQAILLIKELQELKKHDCQRWMEEGAGCSICSRTNKLTKEELKEVQEHINWRISELNKELQGIRERADVEKVRRIIIDKELIPRVMEDSGQAEWTVGESRKLAHSICKYIKNDNIDSR